MDDYALDIQPGTEVFDVNGDKIGSVAEVYPTSSGVATGTPGQFQGTATDFVDGGGFTMTDPAAPEYATSTSTATTATPTVPSTGYFKVNEGGILGIGAKELFIPFSAVQDNVPGDQLTLNCTKDEAENHYTNPPASFSEDS